VQGRDRRLLVSAIDLQNPRATPAGRQLRRSLLDYAASDRFRPAASLTPDELRKLWAAAAGPAKPPGERAFDADLDDGTRKAPPKKSE